MTINRQWLLAARPAGMIGPQNFEYAESPIPTLSAGEVLVKNLFLSFDPTQRNWMVDRPGYLPPVGMGETMRAGSVGQVVDSQHDDFAVGELVQTTGGVARLCGGGTRARPYGFNQVAGRGVARNDVVDSWHYRTHRIFWFA